MHSVSFDKNLNFNESQIDFSKGSLRGKKIKLLLADENIQLLVKEKLLSWHPLEIALWLQHNHSILNELLLDPLQSWQIQRNLNDLFSKKLGMDCFESQGDWVCKTVGHSEIPPFLIWKKEIENYPTCGSVKFADQALIELNKKQITTLDDNYIKKIFTLLKSFEIIDWSIKLDGCDGRADLAYQFLVSAGVPPDALFKQYCFGNSLGRALNCNWNYHVAIGIKDSKEKKWIFDPTIEFEKPLKDEEWIERISNSKIYIEKKIEECPFNKEPNKFYTLSCPFDRYGSSRKFTQDDQIEINRLLALNALVGHTLYEVICNHSMLKQIAGNKVAIGLIEIGPQIPHKESKEKIEKLFNGSSELAILPEDIHVINPKYFSSYIELVDLEKVKLLISNREYQNRRKQTIKDFENEIMDFIPQIESCISKMKDRGFNHDDIELLKVELNEKKDVLLRAYHQLLND